MDGLQTTWLLITSTVLSTRMFIIQSIANRFSCSYETAQRWIFIIALYLAAVIFFVNIHRLFQKRSKEFLRQYTLVYDTILYKIQFAAYSSGQDISWIIPLIKSGSYIQNQDLLLEKIASDEALKEDKKQLKRLFHRHKIAHYLQNSVGSLTVIITLGTYKIFW